MEKSRHFDEDLRAFLTKELDKALNLVDFETYEGADRARVYIEKHIYSNTDFRSSGSVALISHSHLDIAYYWRRIHTVQKNARTILIQMKLMDKYKDFTYCHTQPYIYETLEKYYPEIFAELKEKVASGQFEPVGAMYVEPDCNIPSAESLIRQCLYGQMYYEKAFGRRVDSAWLPDVFGNSWILPQILKKSGVDYFVSNKMSTWNDTNRFPHNSFIWKGIDGTKIAASVPTTHFITWNMPSQIKENWDAYIDKEEGGDTLSMFGYGDGGSGATEEMIELMHRVINEGKYEVSPEEDGFALSLLRSNIRPDIDSDMGEHDIIYAIIPHEGSFIDARVNEKAYGFNSPLIRQEKEVTFENPFPGLFLQAMKLSEDGRKIVFRLLEADGKSGVIKTDGAYEVMNMPEDVLARPMEVEYHPFEIVTLAKEIRQ